jgi:hypothetical protein
MRLNLGELELGKKLKEEEDRERLHEDFTEMTLSPETHYVSATEPNRSMPFGETVAVYCENHAEHTNRHCVGRNTELPSVKAAGRYSNHVPLNGMGHAPSSAICRTSRVAESETRALPSCVFDCVQREEAGPGAVFVLEVETKHARRWK